MVTHVVTNAYSKDITYYNSSFKHPLIAQLVERRTVVELLISLDRWFKSGSVDGNIFFIHNHYISPWQHITMATHHIVTSVYPKDITYYNSSFKHPLIAQLVERRTVVELLISLGRWFKSGSVDGNIFFIHNHYISPWQHITMATHHIVTSVYPKDITYYNSSFKHPLIAQLVERRTVVELLISLGRWFKSGSVDGNFFFIFALN